MTGILADVNIQGHVDYLFHLLTSDDWGQFWQALDIRYFTFRDIGLDAEAADAVVWQACQDHGLGGGVRLQTSGVREGLRGPRGCPGSGFSKRH